MTIITAIDNATLAFVGYTTGHGVGIMIVGNAT
jgi:hypothetical protein